MQIKEFLESHNVEYQVHNHRRAFSAQKLAAEEHVPGMNLAKPVIVQADNQYYMCVLPACYKIDLELLRRQPGADDVELVREKEFSKLFPECEEGAEPPFGNMFNMSTLMDQSLLPDKFIVFRAGKHTQTLQIDMQDYQKLAQPRVIEFGYHLH